jgi:hypothetical protein
MAATAKMTPIQLAKELNVPRAKTALAFFHEDARAKYEAENEGASKREVRAALQEMFAALEEGERAKYMAKEEEDRQRFADNLRDAVVKAGMDLSVLPEQKPKKAKKTRRVTIAKALGVEAPKSAYILFGMEYRKAREGDEDKPDAKEMMRLISAEWKGMSKKQKAKYVKAAKKSRQTYEKELAAAKAAHPEIVEENEKKNAVIRKQRRKTRKNDPFKVKRAKNAYMFFCDANRQRVKDANPEMSAKDVLKTLAAEWKETDKKARKPFQALAKEDKERYEKERLERQEQRMRADEEAAVGNNDDEDDDGNDDEHLDRYEQVRAAIEESDNEDWDEDEE